MAVEEYEQKFNAQYGLCAICGKPEKSLRNGKPISLAVDHNHTTGKVRDLLCRNCNVILGFVGEDIDILLKAAAYIKRHNF